MRNTDVCGNLHRASGCVLHDARTAVGEEISESARTCFREYLQCADLTFPNFKATASSRLKPHAKSTVRILMNTNRSNFSKGNVGSRLGATEWTGSLARFFLAYCEGAKSAKQDSPSAPHICPILTSLADGRITSRIPNKPSENARKSLAKSDRSPPKKLRNGVGADTPIETRCSHKGLPSDTVIFKRVT